MLPSKPMIDQADPIKTEEIIRRIKILVLIVLAALAIWGLWSLKTQWENSKNEKAFAALAPAELIELKVVRDAKVLSQDPVEVLKDPGFESQKEQYLNILKSVIADHKGTSAAHIAALRLGRWHFENAEWDLAQGIYASLINEVQSSQDQALFYALAVEAQSVVHEQKSEWPLAAELLEKALKTKNIPLKPLLLLSQARILALSGKKDEAVKVYESLSKEFPNTPYSQQARALSVKVSL